MKSIRGTRSGLWSRAFAMRIHVHGVRRYVPTASKGKKGLKVVLPQLWIYPKGETTGEMLCDQMKHPKLCTFFVSPLSTQKKTWPWPFFLLSFFPFGICRIWSRSNLVNHFSWGVSTKNDLGIYSLPCLTAEEILLSFFDSLLSSPSLSTIS